MQFTTKNTEILTLIDTDYPATFHVIRAAVRDHWLVIREDENGSELRTYSLPELQKLLVKSNEKLRDQYHLLSLHSQDHHQHHPPAR